MVGDGLEAAMIQQREENQPTITSGQDVCERRTDTADEERAVNDPSGKERKDVLEPKPNASP